MRWYHPEELPKDGCSCLVVHTGDDVFGDYKDGADVSIGCFDNGGWRISASCDPIATGVIKYMPVSELLTAHPFED